MNLFSKIYILKPLKAKARDRKGLGMELALMVLLVTVGCTALMVTSALWGRDVLKKEETRLMQRLEIDEFVEEELSDGVVKIGDVTYTVGSFVCVKVEGSPSYSIKVSGYEGTTDTVVLEFTLDGTTQTITEWTYH